MCVAVCTLIIYKTIKIYYPCKQFAIPRHIPKFQRYYYLSFIYGPSYAIEEVKAWISALPSLMHAQEPEDIAQFNRRVQLGLNLKLARKCQSAE